MPGNRSSRSFVTKVFEYDFKSDCPSLLCQLLSTCNEYLSLACSGGPNSLFGINSRFILPGSSHNVSTVPSAFHSSGCKLRKVFSSVSLSSRSSDMYFWDLPTILRIDTTKYIFSHFLV